MLPPRVALIFLKIDFLKKMRVQENTGSRKRAQQKASDASDCAPPRGAPRADRRRSTRPTSAKRILSFLFMLDPQGSWLDGRDPRWKTIAGETNTKGLSGVQRQPGNSRSLTNAGKDGKITAAKGKLHLEGDVKKTKYKLHWVADVPQVTKVILRESAALRGCVSCFLSICD